MTHMNKGLFFSLLLTTIPGLYADQGSFTNSGGSASGTSGITISGSTVTTPAGTLSMTSPSTGPATCSGGSLPFTATDGSGTTISAVFTSGSYAESCSGGGKGVTIKCYFSLTGHFSGTWTVNGAPQAI